MTSTARVINFENAAKDLHHKEKAKENDRRESIQALAILSRLGLIAVFAGLITIAAAMGGSDTETLSFGLSTIIAIAGLAVSGIGVFFITRCDRYAKRHHIKMNEYI